MAFSSLHGNTLFFSANLFFKRFYTVFLSFFVFLFIFSLLDIDMSLMSAGSYGLGRESLETHFFGAIL